MEDRKGDFDMQESDSCFLKVKQFKMERRENDREVLFRGQPVFGQVVSEWLHDFDTNKIGNPSWMKRAALFLNQLP